MNFVLESNANIYAGCFHPVKKPTTTTFRSIFIRIEMILGCFVCIEMNLNRAALLCSCCCSASGLVEFLFFLFFCVPGDVEFLIQFAWLFSCTRWGNLGILQHQRPQQQQHQPISIVFSCSSIVVYFFSFSFNFEHVHFLFDFKFHALFAHFAFLIPVPSCLTMCVYIYICLTQLSLFIVFIVIFVLSYVLVQCSHSFLFSGSISFSLCVYEWMRAIKIEWKRFLPWLIVMVHSY